MSENQSKAEEYFKILQNEFTPEEIKDIKRRVHKKGIRKGEDPHVVRHKYWFNRWCVDKLNLKILSTDVNTLDQDAFSLAIKGINENNNEHSIFYFLYLSHLDFTDEQISKLNLIKVKKLNNKNDVINQPLRGTTAEHPQKRKKIEKNLYCTDKEAIKTISSLRQDISKKDLEIKNLNNDLIRYSKEYHDLEENIKNNERLARIAGGTSKIKTKTFKDEQIKLLIDENNRYKNRIDILTNLDYEEQINNLKKDKIDLAKTYFEKSENLKLELQKVITENEQLKAKNSNQTDESNALRTNNEDLRNKNYNLESEINFLKKNNQLSVNTLPNNTSLTKISELESKVENLNSIINSLDQVISTLEKDKSFWEQEFMRIEAEFNNHKPELEAQIKVLNQQISDLDNKKNRINDDVASLMKLKEQKILEYQNYIQEGKKWFDLINSCAGNSGSNHKQLSPNENHIEIFKSITGNKENRPKYKISSFEHHQLHEVKNIHSRKTNFILFADSSWLCFDLFMKNAYSTFEDSTDILHLSDVLDIAAKNSHLAFKVIILSANLAPIQHYFSQIKKSVENKIGFVYNNKLISIPENIYWFLQLDNGNYYTATDDLHIGSFK